MAQQSTPNLDPTLGNGNRPLVLYDGGCPMCRREIDHYRRCAGAHRLRWIDIDARPTLEADVGISRSAAMARFHVRTADGRWVTGAHGFAEVWSHLRGYRLVATVVRWLGVLPALDWGYTHFARWRLDRRCIDGACSTGVVENRNPL